MKINRLDEIFKEKGVKNRALGEILKKSESTISLWRNNKRQPSLDDLYIIAKLLRVNINSLIEDTLWDEETSETYYEYIKNRK